MRTSLGIVFHLPWECLHIPKSHAPPPLKVKLSVVKMIESLKFLPATFSLFLLSMKVYIDTESEVH